ncbi:hypothetical protein [Desulfurispirillum indicum]|uniref:hypothetical protein n=1 Tax=Desulfurispirillum indicum TaxID=936456 RepID=UPI00031009F0|nr:hypothetical protein [Desulfurispirillum indicum]
MFLMLAVLLTARIQTLQMSHAAEQRELNSHFQGIMNQIEAQRQLSIVLSEAVAAMPLAQEMFVREDREGLAELFSVGEGAFWCRCRSVYRT